MRRITLLIIANAFIAFCINILASIFMQNQIDGISVQDLLSPILATTIILIIITVILELSPAAIWWHRYWYTRSVAKRYFKWDTMYAILRMNRHNRSINSVKAVHGTSQGNMIEMLNNMISVNKKGKSSILVVGPPGSGKTTGLEKFSLNMSRKAKNRLGFSGKIPITIHLGLANSDNIYEIIKESIIIHNSNRSGKIMSKNIDSLLASNRYVLVFDALDEVIGSKRDSVIISIRKLILNESVNASIVISSRTRQDPSGKFPSASVLELLELDDESIIEFVKIYNRTGRNVDEVFDNLLEMNLLDKGGIGRNPYWLKLIIEGNIFSNSRSAIIKESLNSLFRREILSKYTPARDWELIGNAEMQMHDTNSAISQMAMQMTIMNTVAISMSDAKQIIQQWKNDNISELKIGDIINLSIDSQILSFSNGMIKFSHRLIQEYLCALAISVLSVNNRLQYISVLSRQKDWWEVVIMISSINNDANDMIRHILENPENESAVFLAIAISNLSDGIYERNVKMIEQSFLLSVSDGINENHLASVAALSKLGNNFVVDALANLATSVRTPAAKQILWLIGETKNEYAVSRIIPFMKDFNLAQTCVDVVSRIGEPSLLPLMKRLGDEDKVIRKHVAICLSQIGPSAIELLLSALSDQEQNVRASAVFSLSKMGEPAILTLISLLSNERINIRASAALALGFIGDPAIPKLISLTNHKNDAIREGAFFALCKCGPSVINHLLPLLEADEERVSIGAALALGCVGPKAVKPLANLMKRSDSAVLKRIAMPFKIIDEPAVNMMYGMASMPHGNFNVKIMAINMICRIASPVAAKSLLKLLSNENAKIRYASSQSIEFTQDSKLVDSIIHIYNTDNDFWKTRSLLALAKIGGAKALETIENGSNDESVMVRRAAAKGLVVANATNKLSLVAKMLQDNDYHVRKFALETCKSETYDKILDSINRLVYDDYEDIALASANLIAKAAVGGNDDAIDMVVKMMNHANEDIKIKAISVARQTMNQSFVNNLCMLIKDKSDTIRTNAMITMNSIGGSDSLRCIFMSLNDERNYKQAEKMLSYFPHQELKNSCDINLIKTGVIKMIIEAKEDSSNLWIIQMLPGLRVQKLNKLIQEIFHGSSIRCKKNLINGLIEIYDSDNELDIRIDILSSAIRDSDVEIRRLVVKFMSVVRREDMIASMIKALTDSDPDVVHHAMSGLHQINGDRVVVPLIGALQDTDAAVRRSVVEALGRIGGDRVVDPLAAALKDADATVRQRAVQAFAPIAVLWWNKTNNRSFADDWIGGDRVVDPLAAALQDTDAAVRQRAVEALGYMGGDRVVEPLIGALQDTDAAVRRSVVEALGRIGGDRVVEPLIGALQDTDATVRLYIVEALHFLPAKIKTDIFSEMVLDNNPEVRMGVIKSFKGARSDEVVPILLKAINDEGGRVREYAIYILTSMRSVKIVDELTNLTLSKDEDVKNIAIYILNKIIQ